MEDFIVETRASPTQEHLLPLYTVKIRLGLNTAISGTKGAVPGGS